MSAWFFPRTPAPQAPTFIFPKILNCIWLGTVFENDNDRANVINWKHKHPHYEVIVYIDSCTFDHTSPETIKKVQELIHWAKENDILIRDVGVNPADEIVKLGIDDHSYLIDDCLSKSYYFDESAGQYPNYAAASDILRIEILYRFGGIYFDVGDVFPGDKPMDELLSKTDFLFAYESGGISNDILASVAYGDVITELRTAIYESYTLFYFPRPEKDISIPDHRKDILHIIGNPAAEDSQYLYDYRNPLRTAESKFYRKDVGMFLAGPGAIQNFIQSKYDDLFYFSFPQKYYSKPQEQCGSWYNLKMTKENFLSWIRNVFVFLLIGDVNNILIKQYFTNIGISNTLIFSLSNIINMARQQSEREKKEIGEESVELIDLAVKIDRFLLTAAKLWDEYVKEYSGERKCYLYNPYLTLLTSVFFHKHVYFGGKIMHNFNLKEKKHFIVEKLSAISLEEINENYFKEMMGDFNYNQRVNFIEDHREVIGFEMQDSPEKKEKIFAFACKLGQILINEKSLNFTAYFFKERDRYLADIHKITDWLDSINESDITKENVFAFIQNNGLVDLEQNTVARIVCR
jgi:hypothetical protein